MKIPFRIRLATIGESSEPTRALALTGLDGRHYPIAVWRRYLLVIAANTLCCTVVYKIAEIEYIELIFAFDFLLLCIVLARDGLRLKLFPPFVELAKSYAIFMVCAFLLSLLALRQEFTHSLRSSFLHSPTIVTVSRIAELFLDVFYMLYLASLYRTDMRLCRFAAMTYLWTGLVGLFYSIATYPLNVFAGMDYGTYSSLHRFRGFNNEAGGFGIYLLSVGALAIVMHRRGWLTTFHYRVVLVLLVVGLIGSQSKSGFFAVAALYVIMFTWFLRGWRRGLALIALAAGMVVVGSIVDLPNQVNQYRVGATFYRQYSNLRWGDGNFVMGRVAGAVIAPRMIRARPLTGVGWGNYPLVRDDEEYRQGTAFELSTSDAPSLGVVDYIVELGIPLWLYLVWIELKPVVMLRRRRVDISLIALALVQPISNWAGDHLNLPHPWVVAAFALGLAYEKIDATSDTILAPELLG